MATGAIVARILTQYSNKGSKAAQKDIATLSKSFDGFARNAKRAFGIAGVASAAFAVKLGRDSVQAAMADQKSQVLLANTLRNTTGATDEAIAGVETYITRLQKQFSVVDDDLRPAMARLTAATGSTSAAQGLMQTALDVSASSGADLLSTTNAIVAGTRGQFRALAKLVPGLDAATLATKDYEKILDKVSTITGGAAEKRAQTLEYRLMGLKIAYGEILETLGYALLPVMERFVNIVSTKILPQLETWISMNKDKLAKSFQTATDFFIKMLAVAISFTDWASNNMTTLKNLAILLTTMWAVSKVVAFAAAVNAVTKAFVGLNLVGGTGLVGAMTKGAAKGGIFATGAVALAAGSMGGKIGTSLAGLIPGSKANRLKNSVKAFGTSPMSPSPTDLISGKFGATSTPSIGGTDALKAFFDALNKNTNAVKKNTKTVFDIATENAQKELAARQKKLSGSSTIAIGAAGSKAYGTRGGTTVVVNNAGSVITQENLVTSIVNGIERTTRRSFGTVGAFDK
jgi:hypothetical protein